MNRTLHLPLAFAFLSVSACDPKDPPTVPINPAKSSNEALQTFLLALETADEAALLRLTDGGHMPQEFMRSSAALAKAGYDFRNSFTAAYGDKAWEDFQMKGPVYVGSTKNGTSFTLTLPDFSCIRHSLKDWQANEQNRGRVEIDFDPAPQFHQTQGGWALNGAALFDTKEKLQKIAKHQNNFTIFLRAFERAIGQPGISAADIKYQMGKEFAGIVLGFEFKSDGNSTLPDRFDIHKFRDNP